MRKLRARFGLYYIRVLHAMYYTEKRSRFLRCISQKNGAVFWHHILLGIPFPQTLETVPEGTFAGVSIHSRMVSRV